MRYRLKRRRASKSMTALRPGWSAEYRYGGWANGALIRTNNGVLYKLSYLGVPCGKSRDLGQLMVEGERIIAEARKEGSSSAYHLNPGPMPAERAFYRLKLRKRRRRKSS